MDAVGPRPDLPERPGRWLATSAVPTVSRSAVTWWLGAAGLSAAPADETFAVDHRSELTVGEAAGSWLPYGNPTDLPPDQAREDARSLSFDSPPLTEEFAVAGAPVLELEVASDQPVAIVMVRLCVVSPEGVSQLLTRGALNLTHRHGHDVAEPLEPGRAYRVRIPLKGIAQVVPVGYRIRAAVSTSYWPWLWPAPRPATITVSGGALELPFDGGATVVEPFGRPEIASAPVVEQMRELRPEVRSEVDPETGDHLFHLRRDLTGRQRFASGLVYADDESCVFRISPEDPLTARVDLTRTSEISGPGWHTTVTVRTSMTCDATTFTVASRLEAARDGEQVFARDYGGTYERDLG
jgi:hypothetical protein